MKEEKGTEEFSRYCEKCHKLFLNKTTCPICKNNLIDLDKLTRETCKLHKTFVIGRAILCSHWDSCAVKFADGSVRRCYRPVPEERKRDHIRWGRGPGVCDIEVIIDIGSNIHKILKFLPKKKED